MAWSRDLILAVLAMTALPAAARTYCCMDDNGRRVCGDILPAQCQKRAYQELNSQGVLAQQHEAPLTAEQRAQRNAEAARKKEEERQAAEENRRNRALLASYSSVVDIDAKRNRVLADAQAVLKSAQERADAALDRKKKLEAEAEFYRKKPMPAALQANIRDNQASLAAALAAIEDKKKDIAAIEARFEDEKQRYLKLSQPASSATAR